MHRSVLDSARTLLKRRKFSFAITMLESSSEKYINVVEYYIPLAVACLYVGDIGNATSYFSKARSIKLTDTTLLLGQAAIYLRRGSTDKAVQYYLEVLNYEPENSTAKGALEFIRKDGEYSSICRMVDSGKIERFYPPLGVNPDVIRNCVLLGILAGAVISLCIIFKPQPRRSMIGPRANLEKLELTNQEQKNPQEKDLSGTVVHYILDDESIKKSYENAMVCFQDKRDNASQVEINRLLNSNAAFSVKQKVRTLMSYLAEPTFDTLLDNYTFAQVSSDLNLYLDCWVVWSGRISNAAELENNAWRCDLLVGYEDMKNVEGIVPLTFETAPSPAIDGERPVRILGQVKEDNGRVVLKGKSVYQPLNGKKLQ